jgi:hypothetical protein
MIKEIIGFVSISIPLFAFFLLINAVVICFIWAMCGGFINDAINEILKDIMNHLEVIKKN